MRRARYSKADCVCVRVHPSSGGRSRHLSEPSWRLDTCRPGLVVLAPRRRAPVLSQNAFSCRFVLLFLLASFDRLFAKQPRAASPTTMALSPTSVRVVFARNMAFPSNTPPSLPFASCRDKGGSGNLRCPGRLQHRPVLPRTGSPACILTTVPAGRAQRRRRG